MAPNRVKQRSRFSPWWLVLLPLLLLFPGSAPLAAQTDYDQLLQIDDLWKARHPEQAQALIDTLLPRARASRDTTLLINLLGRRGKMFGALGHSARSEAPLRETLVLARVVSDTFFQCTALRWLGVGLTMQGRYEEGRPFYAQLTRLARDAGLRDFLGWGLAGNGFYRSLDGDEEGAQKDYRDSIAIFRELGLKEAEHFVLLLLGDSLTDLGDFPEARHCYERVGEIGRKTGDLFLQGLSFSNLGNMETQIGDPKVGLNDFREASRLFRLDGSVHEDLAARLRVARCLVTLQMDEAARRKLAGLKKESETLGFVQILAKILVMQSRLVITPEGIERVSTELQTQLNRTQSLDADTQSQLVLALTEMLGRKDGPAAALDYLESRMDSLIGRVSVTKGLELRLARGCLLGQCAQWEQSLDILVAVANRSVKLELVGLELQALPPAAAAAEALGDEAGALSLLERASGSWLKRRSLSVDPYWREVLGTQSRHIYTRLASLLLRDRPGDLTDDGPARAFNAVQIFKARTLQERIAGPGVPTGRLRSVTLENLQGRILRPKEILLDCFLGENEGLVFVVDRHHCRVIRIPGSREIGSRLRSFHQFLANPHRPPRELMRQVIKEVGQAVFHTALDSLPTGSRIIFSPDGDLNFFPLVLVLGKNQGPFSRVPSASILEDLRTTTPPSSDGHPVLLALGTTRFRRGNELPAIGRELAFLGKFTGARVRTSLDPAKLDRQLLEADVLHFATHAQAVRNSPWKSYLEIPAVGDTSWFRLEAGAIADMRLTARLVVLAGCESAEGKVLDGEGVQSLANSFLSAGVPAVLATLWPVDDQATSLLMTRFYSHLAKCHDTSQALRMAQEELAASPMYGDPFFWAGFVIIGDHSGEIPLEQGASWRHHLYWVVPVMGILLFLLVGKRRQLLSDYNVIFP